MGDVWKTRPVVHVVVALVSGAVASGLIAATRVHGQSGARRSPQQRDEDRRQRFSKNGDVEDEDNAAAPATKTSEAAAGFDNLTNGFDPQGPDFEELNEDNVVPLRSFNDNRFIFEEVEKIGTASGPTYNAQSCRECHQNVVTGGASQIAEHRTGHLTDGEFFESLGGSLIQSRATHPDVVELVAFEDDIRTFRISTNTLGAGYRRSHRQRTLLAHPRRATGRDARHGSDGSGPRGQQPSAVRPLRLEEISTPASSRSRPMPISTRWASRARSSRKRTRRAGGDVFAAYDPVPDPEDDGVDVEAFANFMRSHEGTVSRSDHAGGPGWRAAVCTGRLRGLPRCVDDHCAAGYGHQRRSIEGLRQPGEQDDSSVQRLPSARHRDWRRHSDTADFGIRGNGQPDSDCASMGASDSESADARWTDFHTTGGDSTAWRPGSRRGAGIQRLDSAAAGCCHGLPQFVVTVRGRAARRARFFPLCDAGFNIDPCPIVAREG